MVDRDIERVRVRHSLVERDHRDVGALRLVDHAIERGGGIGVDGDHRDAGLDHVANIGDLLIGVCSSLLDDELLDTPLSLVLRELLFGPSNHLVAPLRAEIAVRQADRRAARSQRRPYSSRNSNRSAGGHRQT